MTMRRIFSSMEILRLSQPFAAAQVQNRSGEEDQRHKNKDHVSHAALPQSAKPEDPTNWSVEEAVLGKGDGYLRIL
jgi:hypothetical protein